MDSKCHIFNRITFVTLAFENVDLLAKSDMFSSMLQPMLCMFTDRLKSRQKPYI